MEVANCVIEYNRPCKIKLKHFNILEMMPKQAWLWIIKNAMKHEHNLVNQQDKSYGAERCRDLQLPEFSSRDRNVTGTKGQQWQHLSPAPTCSDLPHMGRQTK